MSGIFGSTTIKGNRITEFADQTSSVGIPIPFGYGTYLTDGNVIWISDVTTHVSKKKQGKGGVKTEEYTYTRSYAIGFCQGPIYGYLTLTRNGKVVYTTDPNAKVEDQAYALKWAQKATFYFGDRVQMPDSTIEAKEGAGNVSAFRDLAYIVVEDDDVTDGAGAVPSYQAVVIASAPDAYLTTSLYPIEIQDSSQPVGQFTRAAFLGVNIDPAYVDGLFDSGSLDTTTGFMVYDNYVPEELTLTDGSFESGDLVVTTGFVTYTNWPSESLSVSGGLFVSGSLVVTTGYVTYAIVPEAASVSGLFISGSKS